MMHRCVVCGSTFEGRRQARTCSDVCRQRRARGVREPDLQERRAERAARSAIRSSRPDACECCGAPAETPPCGRSALNLDHRHDNNEIRGWICTRCNIQVGVMDLQFSDPERFARLREWSFRGAPVVRTESKRPAKRRAKLPEPTLFGRRERS